MRLPELTGTEKGLWETLVFVIRVLIFSVPLHLIMFFSDVLIPLQGLVASNAASVLRAAGYEITRSGIFLAINNSHEFLFAITQDCTGWKSMILLCALLFAVPRVETKKRITGLLAGIPVIYAGNLARIILIVLAEQSYGIEFAMALHDYMWQLGLVLLVMAFWVAWLVWAGRIDLKELASKFK